MAFAIGVFIGMSPLLGIHTRLGIGVAWIFGLNRIVTVVGVFVTNPWTIVPIYSFGTWIGVKVMRIDRVLPAIDWTGVTFFELMLKFKPLVLPFVAGTVILGSVSAVISYFLVYLVVSHARR